jgi:glutaredoxin
VYGNKNRCWDFINQFITIQIKRYRERHLENDQYKELNETFEQNKYNDNELQEVINSNIEYSKCPSVFIGSILGYTNYDDWKKCNKMELFNYQVKHKASDDEEFGKDTKWL